FRGGCYLGNWEGGGSKFKNRVKRKPQIKEFDDQEPQYRSSSPGNHQQLPSGSLLVNH
ncbi:hypothetical protein RUM43_003466, partial [Polyplax serrata]